MNIPAIAWAWLTEPPKPPSEKELLLEEARRLATETHAAAELFCEVTSPSDAENLPPQTSFAAETLTDFLIKE